MIPATSTTGNRDGAARPRRAVLLLAAGLAFWLVIGSFDLAWYYAVSSAKGPPAPWSRMVAANLPTWIVAGLLTPGVVWIARRFRFERGRRLRAAAAHLVTLVLFVFVHVLGARFVVAWQGGEELGLIWLWMNILKVVAFSLDRELSMYLVIVGGVYAWDYYLQFREREQAARRLELERARLKASLADAKLEALRMQLQPHFLFNALHAISTLILRGDPQAANQMLLHLSHFLRMTLDSHNQPIVPLSEELAFLDAYLKIQRERFRDRLKIDVQVPAALQSAQVPSLILQPLVENAIRHGIGGDPGSGRIEILARAEDTGLILQVRDDGPGYRPQSDGSPPAPGVGLRNTRARLEELYPGRHGFTIEPLPGKGTVATIRLPLEAFGRRQEEEEEATP